MPIRTRRKSGPRLASIERRPLWPAVPPPVFTLTLNGSRSSSSWKAVSALDVLLEEMQRLLNRIAAVVHERLGLEQQDAVAADAALAHQAAEFLGPGAKAVDVGDHVERHEADVVAVERILRPRIAETCPDLHHSLPLAGGAVGLSIKIAHPC